MRSHEALFTALTLAAVMEVKGSYLRMKSKPDNGEQVMPINAVLDSLQENSTLLVIEERNSEVGFTLRRLRTLRGAVLFKMPASHHVTNNTLSRHVSQAVAHARQIRRLSWDVVVVVVSDNTTFLSAFAAWSLRGRLLVWTTRLLVFTSLPIQGVQHLHKALSLTNSVLLAPDTSTQVGGVKVFEVIPYSGQRDAPKMVASWTAHKGITLAAGSSLFSEKFEKLGTDTKISVTMTEDATHQAVMEENPEAPGQRHLVFKGYMVTVLDFVAKGLNFSYTFKKSPDGTYGGKKPDGTWTGMVGQVYREEVDIGLGPFTLTEVRYGSVDYTWPIKVLAVRILAGQGRLIVDPWGFLLPLAPLVWVVILVLLFIVPGVMYLCATLFYDERKNNEWIRHQLAFASILVQESSEDYATNEWWWERVLVAMWLLMTLVLSKSYEGNLMSLLAVRHVPQPYQSLKDVLDDPRTNMIWQRGSSHLELIRTATSGVFYEVNEAGKKGRITLLRVKDYLLVVDKDVYNGHHVIIDFETNIMPVRGQHFSLTGRCNFYLGRENVISQSLGLIGHKTNPLVHFMSKWIMTVNEVGLHDYWYLQAIPNSTSCTSLPSKITVSTSFSIGNSWAMFVVLLSGLCTGFTAFLVECLCDRSLRHIT